MAQSVDHDVDIAAIEGHSLPVGILDANGSPDPLYHDENENPGLDDLGFITLRTWANEMGSMSRIPGFSRRMDRTSICALCAGS